MDSFMEMPCSGNLEKLFHIFTFIHNKHNTEMMLEPFEPEIGQACFDQEYWYNTVYSDFSEDILPNAPIYLGFGLNIRVYVESDHAGDPITRRSRTGFIVFLNSAPIYWTSKKQGRTKTSSFSS